MLVSQILKDKGDMVFTAAPSDSVAAVAALLHARHVGAMVVLNEARDVAGIVSERDIVRIVAEKGADGLDQPISDCMTREVIFADPQETVDSLLTSHDRPPNPPPAGGSRRAADRYRVDRRSGEEQDRRDRRRGRDAQGLHLPASTTSGSEAGRARMSFGIVGFVAI